MSVTYRMELSLVCDYADDDGGRCWKELLLDQADIAGRCTRGKLEAKARLLGWGFDRLTAQCPVHYRPSRYSPSRDLARITAAVLAFTLTAPALAQDLPPDPLPAVGEESEAKPPESAASSGGEKEEQPVADPPPALFPRIAAVGWCAILAGEPGESLDGEPAEEAPGCDAGVGAALYSHRIGESEYHASIVASVGERTVGLGVGWCRGRVCIGFGAVALRDDAGIHGGTAEPAVGATFTFGGLRE